MVAPDDNLEKGAHETMKGYIMNEGMENLKQIEDKEKILDFVKTWLNSNITDELQPEVLKADSRDLLEKIEERE